jgi:hypothetical protein
MATVKIPPVFTPTGDPRAHAASRGYRLPSTTVVGRVSSAARVRVRVHSRMLTPLKIII